MNAYFIGLMTERLDVKMQKAIEEAYANDPVIRELADRIMKERDYWRNRCYDAEDSVKELKTERDYWQDRCRWTEDIIHNTRLKQTIREE